MATDGSDHVGHAASEFLGERQVYAFVRGVSVGFGTEDSHGNNLGRRVKVL